MYEVKYKVYENSQKDEKCKPIMLDDKEVYLDLGAFFSIYHTKPITLLITAHYDKDNREILTENIPQLNNYGSHVAINPDLKNTEIINKLKDLSILSNTIDKVEHDGKEYEIVKVDIDILKEYKPVGVDILSYFKMKEPKEISK